MNTLMERLAHIYSERPDLEGEQGQIGLVKASGASRSVVNQWLTGNIKSMDIRYALQIEANLGYSHIWLMANLGDPKVKPGMSTVVIGAATEAKPRLTLATSDELDLLDLFRRSTERGRANITDAAKRATKRPISKIIGGDKAQ